VTSLEKLYELFDNDSNIKRLRSLENLFDKNSEIVDLINQKQHISKEMINAKMIRLDETYLDYKRQYEEINEKIKNYPLLDEYVDLLEYYNNFLYNIVDYIEKNINKEIRNRS